MFLKSVAIFRGTSYDQASSCDMEFLIKTVQIIYNMFIDHGIDESALIHVAF